MQALLLVCLLVVAAGLVTVGVAMLSGAAAFIVAGVEVAAIALFSLADVPSDVQ